MKIKNQQYMISTLLGIVFLCISCGTEKSTSEEAPSESKLLKEITETLEDGTERSCKFLYEGNKLILYEYYENKEMNYVTDYFYENNLLIKVESKNLEGKIFNLSMFTYFKNKIVHISKENWNSKLFFDVFKSAEIYTKKDYVKTNFRNSDSDSSHYKKTIINIDENRIEKVT